MVSTLGGAALIVGVAALSLGVAACSKKSDDKKQTGTNTAATNKPVTSKTDKPDNATHTANHPPKVSGKPCSGMQKKDGRDWFHDDYPAALACARYRNKPLFLDLWAPWCHTCISMQEYIFPDPGLAPLADRFVWAEINTDRDENASLQEKFPPVVWPTFYVVAPEDESVQARFRGAASVSQFREFLLTGEKAYQLSKTGNIAKDSPLYQLREGDRAAARGDMPGAVAAYRAALASAPEDWSRRPDVLVSLIGILTKQNAWDDCAALSDANMDKTGSAASATDFIYRVAMCAQQIADLALADKLRARAVARLETLVDDQSAPLSLDDRSDAMVNLRELYLDLDQRDKALAMAERQRALLDQAANDAPSPWAAMTYNWPRAEVYTFLKKGAELVPVLEKSIADLPLEYDPPYRLGWVYLKMGEPAKGLPYALKALELVYGPRKGRAQTVVANIYKALGDKVEERKARVAVVDIYASLPAGQKRPDNLAAAKKKLAAFDADNPGIANAPETPKTEPPKTPKTGTPEK